MCKVVKYWFACHHGFRLRHSTCGGTKHKSTRSGLATACRSESYLNFVFAVDCGPCQHQAFERGWKHRLTLAETFLEKLKEKGLHGVREVEALVEHMKEEFDTATWNTRTLFPHAHKERTVRVSLGQFQKAPTPLSREVLPEDIPEPFKVIGSDHPDYKYDWDYVASTDPIHPIDTNYAHPLDAVDPSWVLHHLSPEDLEQSGDGFGFDTSEADTIWGSSLEGVNVESTVWVEDASGWTSEAAGFGQSQAPGDPVHAAAPEPQIEGYAEDDNLLSERVDMMIQCFWKVVNGDTVSDPMSQTATSSMCESLDNACQGLHISNIHGDEGLPQTGLLTPPPTSPRLLIDGCCDLESSTSSPLTPSKDSTSLLTMEDGPQSSFAVLQSAAASAPKPTSAYCDRWRQDVTSIKNVDRARYNRELLCLSRWEIKDAEGPNGRFVIDPQLPRHGDAKNGWLK
jgi:hypothetical protein